MGPLQSIEDIIGLIRRRFWLMALVAIIGTALAIVFAKTRPDFYQTASVLQVEMPMVEGTAPSVNASIILNNIEQRLTTRDNLLALIERHNLFAGAPGMSLDDKVWAMRASIQFQSVTGPTGALSAIIISANSGNPEEAARIANDLAQSILDMGAEGRRAAAEASVSFYRDQEKRLWGQITELEAEIAAYRESNRAALPGVREARQDEILQIDSALRELDLEISGLQSETLRLQALEVQRATDRRRQQDITARIDVLNAQRTPLGQRKDTLVNSLGDTAEVERVLAAYDRQLRQYQEQYSAVASHMAAAETSQSLADRQQTERFILLERAIIPQYPVGSGGKKIVIAGAIGSAGLGFILAAILDLIKPVLRNSSQFERELNVRPIVAIPDGRIPKRRVKLAAKIGSLVRNDAGRLADLTTPRNMVIAGGMILLLICAFIAL